MAQAETGKLDTGDRFPDTRLMLLDGSPFSLPSTVNEGWIVFLVYRGHW